MFSLVMVLGLVGAPVLAEEPAAQDRIADFASTAKGSDYDNDLRLAFSCSEAGAGGAVPAKFKNITWKIKGNAPTTDIQKGIVQTDQQGQAVIKINSTLKDLDGVSFVVGIGEEKLNVLAGNGPYIFEELPMSVCAQTQVK